MTTNSPFLRKAWSTLSFVALASFGFSSSAHSDERVGTFSIDNVHLRPTFLSIENQGGQFGLDDSAFDVRWIHDKSFSATVEVGVLSTRNLPIYYGRPIETGYGLTEAFAEYSGIYGRVRYGLLPLNYGYEGSLASQNRLFPWSQLSQNRVVAYNDMGLSILTQNKGYYTELILHNGAIESSPDGRLWATAHFGWKNNREWQAQLSLQTGFVNGDQSTSATTKLAGVQNGQTAKWRHGALFVSWAPKDWQAVIEVAGGQVEQDAQSGGYATDHFELTRFFSQNFGAGLRYDYFDPNTAVRNDAETAVSALLALRSDDGTSHLLLTGTKKVEERYQVSNDELRLTWLMTPYTH
jgi:hypothetical protein